MPTAFTETQSEALAFVGKIDPSNHAANTDNTIAGIDMSRFKRLIAIGQIGVLNANVQGYWEASAQANMNVVTNVANTIPVTANVANRAIIMEVRADQLPANTRYVRPVFIVNTGASFFGAVVLGCDANYKPASQFDLANTVSNRAVT
jgi:hypothetical protein